MEIKDGSHALWPLVLLIILFTDGQGGQDLLDVIINYLATK